jgi:hypothetical protein
MNRVDACTVVQAPPPFCRTQSRCFRALEYPRATKQDLHVEC